MVCGDFWDLLDNQSDLYQHKELAVATYTTEKYFMSPTPSYINSSIPDHRTSEKCVPQKFEEEYGISVISYYWRLLERIFSNFEQELYPDSWSTGIIIPIETKRTLTITEESLYSQY